MKLKTCSAIYELCREREASHMGERPMLNWKTRPGEVGLDVDRTASFCPGMMNTVRHDGQLIMAAYDFGLRGSTKLRNLLREDTDFRYPYLANWPYATFFKIEKGMTVPYHLDEEKHEGFTRRTSLITFNINAPDSQLWVNTDGQDGNVGLSVTGYFQTILCPTGIHHKVTVDPAEDLYLIQIPVR